MKYQLSNNSKSVLNSGLTEDYRKALAEYIWNGFDAGATCVEILYQYNILGGIDDLWVRDNGSGIDHSTLKDTFGTFLDSNKAQTFQRSSEVRGKKGKGRFSYNVLSGGASWLTKYKDDDGVIKRYEIKIYSTNRAEFEATDPEIVLKNETQVTGTIVHFLDLHSDLTIDSFTKESFYDFLSSEFAWFLVLNQSKGYSIKIDGVELDYRNLIGDTEEQAIQIGSFSFKWNFIRWKKKIGEKYYNYFMNANLREVYKEPKSFNNKNESLI